MPTRAALKGDPIKGPGAGRRGLFLFKEEIVFMLFSRHPRGDCRKAQTLIVKQRVGAKIGVCRVRPGDFQTIVIGRFGRG